MRACSSAVKNPAKKKKVPGLHPNEFASFPPLV
jgi:hypothetical protein